ncbi:MAG: serine hydrolase [Arenicellales bacterium]
MNTGFFNPPEGTDLSNWRESPYSRWTFQNVRELIPSAVIAARTNASPIPQALGKTPDLSGLHPYEDAGLEAFLVDTHTDSLVILHRGNKVWQWQADHCDRSRPHIVFSVSKSISAMLAGILVDQGAVEVDRTVSHYLPGTRDSAYADCTVQHVLDMTVALDFKEEYLNPSGDYFRYRNATGWNPVDQTKGRNALEVFLYSLGKADFEHGEIFNYKSPNSDLLGLLIERAGGMSFAELLSEYIWQPMGAESDGYVTVDREMLARAAGGICITIDDLARFGDLVMNQGAIGGTQIIPQGWITDTLTQSNPVAWSKGDMINLLPKGAYRNKWYQIGDSDRCFMALGIHGQWLYVNPATSVVIAKLSSQPDPVNETLDLQHLKVFNHLSKGFSWT